MGCSTDSSQGKNKCLSPDLQQPKPGTLGWLCSPCGCCALVPCLPGQSQLVSWVLSSMILQ